MSNVVVVGSGIVGLAVAARLAARGDTVTVLEKEPGLAMHQTGRNSGVIHSGLYYAPGSLKATMCIAAGVSMTTYATEHGVPVETCGKLVVATSADELPGLRRLADRAAANGVPARLLDAWQATDYEPNVNCVAALRVESTGIIDYPGVCRALAQDVLSGDGEISFDEAFVSARTEARGVRVVTSTREILADSLITCAGLQSDRVAAASGLVPEARIIPFRGEYYELAEHASGLVNGLIYPVPDPGFPFLGVHLTRMIDGSVHAGPNAVLALAREGYRWRTVVPADVASALSWPGLWRLAARNVPAAAGELRRSLSRRAFARSLARLVPAIGPQDIVPSAAGVRAQAMRRDGSLVDDFLVQRAPRQLHVLNAPSPAATCSLEIAGHLVGALDEVAA